MVQSPGEPGDEADVVAAPEVIGPEVVIVGAVAQHDVDGGEHGPVLPRNAARAGARLQKGPVCRGERPS